MKVMPFLYIWPYVRNIKRRYGKVLQLFYSSAKFEHDLNITGNLRTSQLTSRNTFSGFLSAVIWGSFSWFLVKIIDYMRHQIIPYEENIAILPRFSCMAGPNCIVKASFQFRIISKFTWDFYMKRSPLTSAPFVAYYFRSLI